MDNWLLVKKKMVDECIAAVCDLGYTPYIQVFTEHPYYIGAQFPVDSEGNITLNIGVNAVKNFNTSDSTVYFNARVSGQVYNFEIPYGAIKCVTTSEDPLMAFELEVDIPDVFLDTPEVTPEVTTEVTTEVTPEVTPEVTDNVIQLSPDSKPWRNPNANPNWASRVKVIKKEP